MDKKQEKTSPVIVVKKRRTWSISPETEKKEVATPPVTATTQPETPETTTPAATKNKSGKKGKRKQRPQHWTREYTSACITKMKEIFPHLRAEGGGFLPLKKGITKDIPSWLEKHPDAGFTLDEWKCAASCITSRLVYLKRIITGAVRYDLAGKPAGEVTADEAYYAAKWLAVREKDRNAMLAEKQAQQSQIVVDTTNTEER